MKFNYKAYRNTIFSRLFLFNSLLTIIISIIIIALFYYTFSRIYLQKIKENNLQLVQEVQMAIDKDVFQNTIQIPSIHFTDLDKNKVLIDPLTEDIGSNMGKIYEISRYLMDTCKTYKYIDSIDIYYKKSQLIFDNGHIIYLNDIKEKQLLPYWFDIFLKNNSNVLWLTNDEVITYVRTIPFFKEDYEGIIAININKSYINDYLATKKIKDRTFFIVNSKGRTITSNGNDFTIAKEKIMTILAQADISGYPIAINQHKVMLSFVPSEFGDWFYLSMESIDDFYKELRQLSYYTVMISLLILLINFIVAFMLTKKAHQPLNQVIQNIKHISQADLNRPLYDDNNEYTLIDSTVKNLAVTVMDLNYTLDFNRPIIRYNLIRELLTGKTSIHKISEDAIYLTDIELDKDYVFCFMLHITIDGTIREHDRLNINYNVISMLENYTEWHCHAIYNNDCITGIINYSNDKDYYRYIVERLSENLSSLLEMNYHLIIGQSMDLKTLSIHQSYCTALDCEAYHFLYPGKPIIIYSDLDIANRKNFGSSTKVLKKLEQNIKLVNMETINFLIQGIQMSLKDGNYTINYAKNTLRDVVSTINNTLFDMGFDPFDIFASDLRVGCQQLKNIDEFNPWIEDKVIRMVDYITSQRKTITPDLKENIIQFIDKNIYDDISLDMIADAFNMRGDTFSKTFKTIIGENYCSYIKNKKMIAAKALLEKKTMNVAEIADVLGYSSSQYFIKSFKTKYGITPKKYQQQLE